MLTPNRRRRPVPPQPAPAVRTAKPRQPDRVVQIAPSGIIQAIQVEGNQRIETGTIEIGPLLVRAGDAFDRDRLDRSLKTLYATGLFQDVQLTRNGNTLVVHVVENPIVNQVAFEGNHKMTDDQLRADLQLRPRSVFTPAMAEADRQHILDMYSKVGYYDASVDPKIIRLPDNRVNVVFPDHRRFGHARRQNRLHRQQGVQPEPAERSDQQPQIALVALSVEFG